MKIKRKYQDRLVTRISYGPGCQTNHGKRVAATCKLTREEIRAYVEHGSIEAIKLIRERTGLGLYESKQLLDSERYNVGQTHQTRPKWMMLSETNA